MNRDSKKRAIDPKREWTMEKLDATSSPQEWDRIVDEIRADHGGRYPAWWFKDLVNTTFFEMKMLEFDEAKKEGKE